MKLLCLLLSINVYGASLSGFAPPKTEDDSEACYGAEQSIMAQLHAGYRPYRQACIVNAPEEGKIRTYEVIACVKKAPVGGVCDGFSGVDTSSTNAMCLMNPKAHGDVCEGFNIQLEDGAYIGVSMRDDLTKAYTEAKNKP